MSVQFVPLEEVCEINPSTALNLRNDSPCTFVPMEAVDDWTAQIVKLATRPFCEVSKGYTSFAENDVLLAKITPCMENGKCAIARGLRNRVGFGSTEFHVLRCSKHVIPEWLLYFWRLPETRLRAERCMTGTAGQKRVSASYLAQAKISLPSLNEQLRIAEQLEQADRLRRTRRYALELSDSFLPAAFLELFGDPRTNPHAFEVKPAGNLFHIQLGKMLDAKQFTGKNLRPYLGNSNVQWERFDLNDLKEMDFSPRDFERFKLYRGDLLVCEGGEVGRAAIWKGEVENCCYQKALHRLRPKDEGVLPVYFLHFMRAVVDFGLLAKHTTFSTISHFTAEKFEELSVIVPPLSLQQKFAALVERHERLRATQREALRQAEHLFQTLLHRAFDQEP